MLTPEQLEKHNTSITGSKVASILGISPFKSRYLLWAEMTGLAEVNDISTERMRMGSYAEAAIDEYCKHELGWQIRKGNHTGKTHKDYPQFFGLIDRFKIENGKRTAIIEYKNIDSLFKAQWQDGPPAHYEAQCRFYSILYDLPCILVAVFGGNSAEVYHIERNAEIETFIINECLKFWDMVQTMTAPEPDGSSTTADALAKLYPQNSLDMIDGNSSIETLINRYSLYAAIEKRAEEKKNEFGNKIKAIIGEHEGVVCESGAKATWKLTKPSAKFDEKQFAADNPELYQKYVCVRPGYRRFNCTPAKPNTKQIAA